MQYPVSLAVWNAVMHIPAVAWRALLLALCPTGMALARTPYLLPTAFDVRGGGVTLVGATTEDDYFTPDGGLAVPALVETTPAGQAVDVKATTTLKDLTVIEAGITAPGTYRFSTGQYVMRTTTFVNVDGKWLFVRQPRGPRLGDRGGRPPESGKPGGMAGMSHGAGGRPGGGTAAGGDSPPNSIAQADVPAGAPSKSVESISVVETYVTKSAPTDTALSTTGRGFELKPVTHPNAVYVDQGFAFQVLVDGQPVAGALVSVYRAGNIYDDRRVAAETKTDAKGMAKVRFDRPGVYLLTTHSAAQAPSAEPMPRNYTYSLTFEVTR